MRTHYCGELNRAHIDQEVILCGWAHRRRDHGGVIFIDLRDNKGLAQIVIDPDTKDAFSTAESIRNEYVLKVTCKVRLRPEGTINKNLPTGEVEMLASTVEILNPSLTLLLCLMTTPLQNQSGLSIASLIFVVIRCKKT